MSNPSNLSNDQLGVFDLETGLPNCERLYGTPFLLMPWQANDALCNPQLPRPNIRMWSGLLPGATVEYKVFTWEDYSQMLMQLIMFLVESFRSDGYIATWNGVFDVAWLHALGLGELARKVKWIDTMQLLKRAKSNDFRLREELGSRKVSFGLKQAVKEYFPGIGVYNEDIDFFDNSPEMTTRMAEYCVKDSIFTHTLTILLANTLSAREWNNAMIEASAIYPVAAAWVNGIDIDETALHILEGKLTEKIHQCSTELEKIIVTPTNVNSPSQLARLLFEEWKHVAIKYTAAGAPSTDKDTLTKLASIDPRVQTLLDYRTALRNKQKFVDTPMEAMKFLGNNIVHPQGRIYGTYTGRMTVDSSISPKEEYQTGIALHQWKNDPEYRSMICTRGAEDCSEIIVEVDAGGQEFRWMAIASGDPTMLSLCMPGEDPHSYMGATIHQADYKEVMEGVKAEDPKAKKIRKLGKLGNLSLQYRTSADKLRTVARVQYQLDLEEPESRHIHTTYQRTYSGVPVYWNRQIALARREGCVWTFGGRKIEILGDWGNRDHSWSMESTAINAPIQGTGADQKYLALQELEKLNLPPVFMFDLHDGLIYSMRLPKNPLFRLEVINILTRWQEKLNNLPYEEAWGFKPPIPLPWDIKWGFDWGHMKLFNPDTFDQDFEEALRQKCRR